jgi:transcriptional regulator with XRE-family HTH domain
MRYVSLMEITPEQIRAARALLRLEQAELAERAHVSVVTIRRLERARGSARVAPGTLKRVREVLEQAGAEFVPDGVRRRRAARPDARALFEDLRAISLLSASRLQGHELLTDADLYDENSLPA